MGTTPVTSLRLKRRAELEELASRSGQSQAEVVDRLIAESHAAVNAEAREQATRSVALLRRLQERLGEEFWREHGADEVAFEVDAAGRVSVSAGEVRFIEADNKLIAVRASDGRTELAEVIEDGLAPWISAYPGEPAFN